ncbi:MAG: amidase [Frankiaceae bacterium]
MTELHELSAVEQAAAIRRRELDPVELTEHYLARIEQRSDAVGAFITVTADAALAAARAASQLVRDGGDLPPLHGVPTAIKDLNLTAGVRTTLGSAVFADNVPHIDDHVVRRLRAAGTISLGKTNTPEFGVPCYTEPDVAPPARSPWDLQRTAGGSSGGAAAAVAAGLVPFAQASDGGGSIRTPAACCGLIGLKPARGRVSLGPVVADLHGLGTIGPIARTVRDAAAMLDAMTGPFAGDPHWAAAPQASFASHADRPPPRLRIGRYRASAVPDAVLDADCLAAWESASALLAELGHEVEDTEPPFGSEQLPVFERVWSVSAAMAPVAPADEARLRPLTRWHRERGRSTSAVTYAAALGHLQRAAREAVQRSAAYDAVLVPTLATLPPAIGALRNDADPAADFAAQLRFTPYAAMYNVTGQPAITVPVHRTATGFPVSVMLAGRPADEGTLIALAAELTAARPEVDRTPPLW